jgi:hypothetical protein
LAIRRSVRALFLELHLSDAFIPPTPQQYNGLWSALFSPVPLGGLGMSLAFRHDNIGEFGSPYRVGRISPALAALGAPVGQCCVEFVFVKNVSQSSASWPSLSD